MTHTPDTAHQDDSEDLLPEYDLASMPGAVRGKYAQRAQAGSNVVLIDPDVATVFPDAESVNFALRHMAAVLQHERQQSVS